jgi:hypothetical protein
MCKIWNCQVLHYDIKLNLKKNMKFWAKKWFNLFVNNVENLMKKVSQEWYNWPMNLWKSWENEWDRCGLT